MPGMPSIAEESDLPGPSTQPVADRDSDVDAEGSEGVPSRRPAVEGRPEGLDERESADELVEKAQRPMAGPGDPAEINLAISDETSSEETTSLSDESSVDNILYDVVEWPSDPNEVVSISERFDYFSKELQMADVSPKRGCEHICRYILSHEIIGNLSSYYWLAIYPCFFSVKDVEVSVTCLVQVKKVSVAEDYLKEPQLYAECQFIKILEMDVEPLEEELIGSEQFYRRIQNYMNERCKWIDLTELSPTQIVDTNEKRTIYEGNRKILAEIARTINHLSFWQTWIYRPYDVDDTQRSKKFKNYEQLLACRLTVYDLRRSGHVDTDIAQIYDRYTKHYYEVLKLISDKLDTVENLYSSKRPTDESFFDDDNLNKEFREMDELVGRRNQLGDELQMLERERLSYLAVVGTGSDVVYRRMRNGVRRPGLVKKCEPAEEDPANLDESNQESSSTDENSKSTQKSSDVLIQKSTVHFVPGPAGLKTLALADIDETTDFFTHELLDHAVDQIYENETIYVTKTVFEPKNGLAYLNEDNVRVCGLGVDSGFGMDKDDIYQKSRAESGLAAGVGGNPNSLVYIDGPPVHDAPNVRILGDNIILENLLFLQNDGDGEREEGEDGDGSGGGSSVQFLMQVEARNCTIKNCRLYCTGHGIELKENFSLTLIDTEIIKDDSAYYGSLTPDYYAGLGADFENTPIPIRDGSVGILKRVGSKLTILGKSKISGFEYSTQTMRVVNDHTFIGPDCQVDGQMIISRVGFLERDMNELQVTAGDQDQNLIEKVKEESPENEKLTSKRSERVFSDESQDNKMQKTDEKENTPASGDNKTEIESATNDNSQSRPAPLPTKKDSSEQVDILKDGPDGCGEGSTSQGNINTKTMFRMPEKVESKESLREKYEFSVGENIDIGKFVVI